MIIRRERNSRRICDKKSKKEREMSSNGKKRSTFATVLKLSAPYSYNLSAKKTIGVTV
jgi:hypothetical protein